METVKGALVVNGRRGGGEDGASMARVRGSVTTNPLDLRVLSHLLLSMLSGMYMDPSKSIRML